jgi:hypothetical protein
MGKDQRNFRRRSRLARTGQGQMREDGDVKMTAGGGEREGERSTSEMSV